MPQCAVRLPRLARARRCPPRLLRRLIQSVLILIGVNLATFFLFFTVNTPDDMARLNIGGKRVTQELIEKWKGERGYDKPLYWNADKRGSETVTQTIFWERSISLFTLQFGRGDKPFVCTASPARVVSL